jgi:uncharacterized membrane protein YfcA
MALLGATTTLALRRVPRMSLRLTTHPLASQAAGPSGVGPACFGSGLAGGMMGGLIGLGGGVVMVPMMTAFARMTQHQAVGTSSLAVAAVGLSSCASFGSAGAVDFVAAAAVATTAMVGARVGAKLTTRFDAVQLQRVFAAFQICIAPMVPAKAYLTQVAKASEHEAPAATVAPVARGLEALLEPQRLWDERGGELATLAAVGVVCGVAAGLFGIGGGVVVTPALCLLTEVSHPGPDPGPDPGPGPGPDPDPNLNQAAGCSWATRARRRAIARRAACAAVSTGAP